MTPKLTGLSSRLPTCVPRTYPESQQNHQDPPDDGKLPLMVHDNSSSTDAVETPRVDRPVRPT